MNFTHEQIEEIVSQYLSEGNLNKLFETILNCLMKSERNIYLAENTSTKNKGNGFRTATYTCGTKQLKMRIPRDRLGQFYPLILGIMKDNEEEMHRVAFELYSKGLSQQDVGDVFKTIYKKECSKSSISRMAQEFQEEIETWRKRPLEAHYPVLIIDALFSNVRRAGTVSNEATYTIIALKSDMTRDIISLEHLPIESASGWEEILRELRDRGMKTTDLIIADGLSGLENSIPKVFPGAQFQKCVVHLKRGIMLKVASRHKPEIKLDLLDVFKIGDSNYSKQDGMANLNSFIDKWGKHYVRIKNLKKLNNLIYYFTYLDYDYRVQSMIYTTNWVENLNKRYRRTLKIRNSMPNEEAVLLLLGKVAIDKVKKYLAYPIYNFKFDSKLFPG